MFWVVYFVILVIIKEIMLLDWGVFVNNFVINMCWIIVGFVVISVVVLYVLYYFCLILRFFLYGCENVIVIFEINKDL